MSTNISQPIYVNQYMSTNISEPIYVNQYMSTNISQPIYVNQYMSTKVAIICPVKILRKKWDLLQIFNFINVLVFFLCVCFFHGYFTCS